jgi:hypothetical protein
VSSDTTLPDPGDVGYEWRREQLLEDAGDTPAPHMDDTHECPRGGCTRRVPPHMLMCRADWHSVPRALRQAVWAAWDNGQGAGSPAHRAAITAAISSVSERNRSQ